MSAAAGAERSEAQACEVPHKSDATDARSGRRSSRRRQPRQTINLIRSVGFWWREPPNHHPPPARDRHDRRTGIRSAVLACHGRRDAGCCDVRDGERYVDVRNRRRNGKRHAVLSVQGAGADRLRQMPVHGRLHVEMLHRPVVDRLPSVAHDVERCRGPAE